MAPAASGAAGPSAQPWTAGLSTQLGGTGLSQQLGSNITPPWVESDPTQCVEASELPQGPLHGGGLFASMLESSWWAQDQAASLAATEQQAAGQSGLGARLTEWGAWGAGGVMSGLGSVLDNGATAVGTLATMPGLGDWWDFGKGVAGMGWQAATDSSYRDRLADGATRKDAVKEHLGNPSETQSLNDLRPVDAAARDQQVMELLGDDKEAIIAAAQNNDLEPELVGALGLAEQRDQSGAENVMDWIMGVVAGDGQTSVGPVQGTANSSRRYDMVDDHNRMSDRQLAIALHDPATGYEAGARRLRQGADLGALAEDQGRNHAVDDVLDPGVRVDLGVMDEHSSNWDDSHRRIAIDEYTSAPFDDDMLNGGHAANASPGGWGWFAVQGYDDIQHSQLFDEQVCP